jgi:hypothetical protein
MSQWLVSSTASRIELDAENRGELRFTVVNSGPAPEQVVFDVAAGPAADRAWFEIAGASRVVVLNGAAVDFQVRVALPAGTPPGQYSVQGLAYSAGRPESASVGTPVLLGAYPDGAAPAAAMAGAIAGAGAAANHAGGAPTQTMPVAEPGGAAGQPGPSGAPTSAPPTGPAGPAGPDRGPASGPDSTPPPTAPPAPAKPKRRGPVIIGVAIGLVVLLGLAAGAFFLLRNNDDGQADAAPPPPPAEVVVPDVTLLPQQQATAILEVSKSIRQGTTVESGTAVDLAVVDNP